MRNDGLKSGDGRGNNGIIPNSFKALSRIVSSGASTVASTVRSAASAASAMVDRDSETSHDQVSWTGFDKLELEKSITRQVLLLAYSYGFQVWDVEVAENVCNLVTRHDGPVSFMQMLPKPVASKQSEDKFADSRPLLIICADGSFSGGTNVQEGSGRIGSHHQHHGSVNGSYAPMVVRFYSLKTQAYVHILRFRSVVHLVRCSSRVVAVLQSSQIHCLNASTLEREYTILTNPVVSGCYGPGNIGLGPLAVGPRWMAYSGSQVSISHSGRVTPQHLTPSPSFPCPASNGSLVAHYAKESSKQIAAGIVTLGDMGYKKLSRYYSDLLPEANNCQSGKVHGVANGHLPDADNIGMVIVRDIVSKSVIAQFRAHKSPIASLCFDPNGTLLVTASVQGHNINVFRIMPGDASGSSSVHLYRLQRGLTNAIIQDISFSNDSQWVMVSSTRGTSHLFAISPSGGSVSFQSTNEPPNSRLQVLTQQSICDSGPPVTLSAISRIRSGNNGWRNTVSGAAAAATGRTSSLSGTIASAFHNCKNNYMNNDNKKSYYLLVFSPSGCVIQYALRISPAFNGVMALPGGSESGLDSDARLTVEPIQKWNICQKQNRKDRDDNIDLYEENGNPDNSKVYPERMKNETNLFSDVYGNKTTKEKITNEEKHHMYISEAELQMHQNRYPLWARSEVYFQAMLSDGFNVEGGSHGEFEIERVNLRTLEARSKNLIPVFDYLQNPKFHQGRTNVINSENVGQIRPEGSDLSEDGKLANGVNNHDETEGQDGLLSSTETRRGFVNTNDSTPIVNARLETVNNRDDSDGASQLRSVHNSDDMKTENRFAEDDELG